MVFFITPGIRGTMKNTKTNISVIKWNSSRVTNLLPVVNNYNAMKQLNRDSIALFFTLRRSQILENEPPSNATTQTTTDNPLSFGSTWGSFPNCQLTTIRGEIISSSPIYDGQWPW